MDEMMTEQRGKAIIGVPLEMEIDLMVYMNERIKK